MVTGLPLVVGAAVLGSAVLHATWNAIAKAIPHQLLASALIGVSFLVFGGIWCALAPVPHAASWPYLTTSAVLQTGYLLLLTAAYSRGEFRRVYPVARGTAPLLVTTFSLVVLGERLHATQLAGIALVAAALAVLAFAPGRGRSPRGAPAPGRRTAASAGGGRVGTAGLGLAVATGVLIATYSLVDGLGVRHSGTAAGYAAWLMALHGPLMVITCIVLAGPRRLLGWLLGRDLPASRIHVTPRVPHPAATGAADPVTSGAPPDRDAAAPARPLGWIVAGLAGGILSLAAYAIVLWAQSQASLSMVSALRETSVLFAGVIGAAFFAERFSARQSIAAVAVVGGIVLMQVT